MNVEKCAALASDFDALQELIENATQPVTLVTHSMGGPVALAFLNQQSVAWKAQHIKAFVPISPPFGGAVSTAMSMISGDNFGVSVMNPKTFRPIQASCASGPWLLPQPALWASSETVVKTAVSSYGARDWPRLFADSQRPVVLLVISDSCMHLVGHGCCRQPPALLTHPCGLHTYVTYVLTH